MNSSFPNIATPDTRETEAFRPLRVWAKRLQKELPPLSLEPPRVLPDAVRTVLDHHDAMTATLERQYQGRITLEVIEQRESGRMVDRLVRLRLAPHKKSAATAHAGTVVEIAALEIHLDGLPSDARHAVLAGKAPLGSVLKDYAIAHRHAPRGFFHTTTNAWFAWLLECDEGMPVGGRSNAIYTPQGGLIAEIVEVLPNPETLAKRNTKGT